MRVFAGILSTTSRLLLSTEPVPWLATCTAYSFTEPGMLFGLVVLFTGSENELTTLVTDSDGPLVTTTFPLNSEVSPLTVAVDVSVVPTDTAGGGVMRNAKRFVVSVPCRRPLIAAAP